MHFWSGRNVVLHVLDGSPKPINPLELSQFSENIHYHHSETTIHDRLMYVTKLIETEYCSLIGDDEFFLPSGLQECIYELDRNGDLISCAGRCVIFNYYRSSLVGQAGYLEMENYSVTENNPLQRMEKHMDPYTSSTIYGVTRSFAWKRAVTIICSKTFLPFNLDEIQYELAIAYFGKSKVIQVLTWFRSLENTPVRDLQVASRNNNYFIEGWWLNPSNDAEHKLFLDIMARGLLDINELKKIDEVVAGVKKALNAYVVGQHRSLSLLESFRKKILVVMPNVFKKPFRKLRILRHKYISNRVAPNLMPLSIVIQNLANQGVKVDSDEVSFIETTILNFYAR